MDSTFVLLLRDRFQSSNAGSISEFEEMLRLINKHTDRIYHPFHLPRKSLYPPCVEIGENTIRFFENENIINSYTFCDCQYCDTTNFREGWGGGDFCCDFCGNYMPPKDEHYDWKGHQRHFKINPSLASLFCNKCSICGDFTGNKTNRCRECTSKDFDEYSERHNKMVVRLSDYLVDKGYRVLHESFLIDILAVKADEAKTTWVEIVGFEVKHSDSDSNINKALKQAVDKRRYCDKLYIVLPSCNEENLKKIKSIGAGCITMSDRIDILLEPLTITKKQELWSALNTFKRQALLRKYNIKGRTKAYKDSELAFKLLLGHLGEEKLIKGIRASIIWHLRPWDDKTKYVEYVKEVQRV